MYVIINCVYSDLKESTVLFVECNNELYFIILLQL